jgi:hypothetical protein
MRVPVSRSRAGRGLSRFSCLPKQMPRHSQNWPRLHPSTPLTVYYLSVIPFSEVIEPHLLTALWLVTGAIKADYQSFSVVHTVDELTQMAAMCSKLCHQKAKGAA